MANESDDQRHSDDVDYIIKDLGGTFGRHQIYMYILIAIPIWMSSVFVLDYVFTTLDLDYRWVEAHFLCDLTLLLIFGNWLSLTLLRDK